jgi:hypothetical protein
MTPSDELLKHHLDERELLIRRELSEHESNNASELKRHRTALSHIETVFRLRLGATDEEEGA